MAESLQRPVVPFGRGAEDRTRTRRALLAGVIAVAALGAAACSGSDDATTTDASVPPATTATSPSSTQPEATADTPPEVTASTAPEPEATAATTDVAAPLPDFSAIGPVVQTYLDTHGMNGAGLVVVDRDAGVVHEEYWGEFDAERVSLIASSSKMIVAGVLMRLDDQGLLDVDAPVADVADWGSGNPTITPAQLVSNSSGLVGLLPDPGYGPYLCQFLPTGTLQSCAEAVFTTPDDDADVIAPDTAFRYGGAQWQVAGAVAEIAAGATWAELVDETYVEPCGVDSLAFNNHWTQFAGDDPFGYPADFDGDPTTLAATDNPNMEGGAYITAPDYAALLLMHLRDGRCGDTQVLSSEALARMHGDRTGATYGSPQAYGMGWFVDAEAGRISDPGAFGATPWLDLDGGYGAYLVVEGDTGPGLAAELYPLVDAAFAAAG
jgi:CubicO group peptidase (beta-lactamase class C family)